MKYNRIRYRSLQFWNALFAKPAQADLELAREILTPTQMGLFSQMQSSEQSHSLNVMKKILESIDGDVNEGLNDLLVAALLHDVGKTNYRLRVWERIIVVIGKLLFPDSVKRWGAGEPKGWRRAFVIAEQHPKWGAELALNAGASLLATDLIRHHQNYDNHEGTSLEAELLFKLQLADQKS